MELLTVLGNFLGCRGVFIRTPMNGSILFSSNFVSTALAVAGMLGSSVASGARARSTKGWIHRNGTNLIVRERFQFRFRRIIYPGATARRNRIQLSTRRTDG